MNNFPSLAEVLVKTSFLTQITGPSDKLLETPVAYGSGFMIDFQKDLYFVTADHTLHLEDYKEGVRERTGAECVVSIFNNYTPPDNILSTAITPLGGFYYIDKHNLEKPSDVPELIDITVCKMKPLNLKYPFLTDGVIIFQETINAGEPKFNLFPESFAEPHLTKNYFIFGKIRTNIIDGIRMEWENTLKEGLQFKQKAGDYYLFNSLDLIKDEEDWSGLSGSPVISEDGECVGVLCDVKEGTNSIWVMPIAKVKMLIEVVIQEERLYK